MAATAAIENAPFSELKFDLDITPSFDHPCSVLLAGLAGSGKRSVVNAVCRLCNVHVVEINCHCLSSDSSGASEAKIKEAFRRGTVTETTISKKKRDNFVEFKESESDINESNDSFASASLFTPCVIYLTNVDSLGISRETNHVDNRVSSALCRAIQNLPRRNDEIKPAVVIATTCDKSRVVPDIRLLFLHQVKKVSSSLIALLFRKLHFFFFESYLFALKSFRF